MYEFKYHRPATVRQAANLLIKNEDAKVIAGGHTLLPVMKQRLASPPHLVDLSHIEGLDSIEMKGRSLVIGATATHNTVATSAIVGEAIPALAELAGMIGDPAVRHKGTIGGSLANNDPTADYPAACVALGATIVTNKRRLKPEELFQGLFTTALESDEIITRVMFPLPKRAAYIKFRNQASRYALVGVFVAKRPSDVRVAVTGAGSEGVFRVTSFEEALKKRFSAKALDGMTVPAEGLNRDPHGSAEYRAQMIAIRLAEAAGDTDREQLSSDIFAERYLIKRPLLQALEPDVAGAPVLLIDELDRADEAFEAYLLEILSDFQVTIPELGTVKAPTPPIVIVTSNRTRELHDALKRRCLYHWVDYPSAERELAIVKSLVPGISAKLSQQVVGFVQALREQDFYKSPGVAETIDWATALTELDARSLTPQVVGDTLGALLKYQDDIARMQGDALQKVLKEATSE